MTSTKKITCTSWGILCDNKALCLVGGWFSFWAGALNALATYSLLYLRTTHLTGPATDQAVFSLTNLPLAILVSIVVFSFVGGAFFAARFMKRFNFTLSMVFPAVPLTTAWVLVQFGLAATGPDHIVPGRFLLAALLPFAAGWQNSVSTIGRLGRTTHHTGNLTDMAIALAEGNYELVLQFGTKYLAFVAGGVVGFLGSRYHASFTLAAIIVGYTGTVAVFYAQNLGWLGQNSSDAGYSGSYESLVD